MKKRAPKTGPTPTPPDAFLRFQGTLKKLLAVSKKDLDDLRAAERAKTLSDKTRPD